MSDGTKIEWTDATVNAINGCMVVSPGCANCYAMKQAHRFPVRQGLSRPTNGGMVWTGEVRFAEKVLEQVLRWQRPRRIFWNAHGDTFYERVPDDWIDRCFAVMALTPHHTHQVLTKRPERMRAYCDGITSYSGASRVAAHIERLAGGVKAREFLAQQANLSYVPNVWLGTSVEDQKRAEERVPILLDTPAAVRWLSCEPLLGPVDLTNILVEHPALGQHAPAYLDALVGEAFDAGASSIYRDAKIDWVVVGGESGPGSRPMHPAWVREVRDACERARTAFHFKQWGDWRWFEAADLLARADAGQSQPKRDLVYERPDSRSGLMVDVWRIGKREAGRLLDGVSYDGYPA